MLFLTSACLYSASTILSAWTTRQIHSLLAQLRLLLPRIQEGASLRSVLEQALFFANRMSQVGCDFSSLLLPVFKEAVCLHIERDLRRAGAYFRSMVLTERVSFTSGDPDLLDGGDDLPEIPLSGHSEQVYFLLY